MHLPLIFSYYHGSEFIVNAWFILSLVKSTYNAVTVQTFTCLDLRYRVFFTQPKVVNPSTYPL
jgi:hypothetical protein